MTTTQSPRTLAKHATAVLAAALVPGILSIVGSGCARPAPGQTQPIYFRHDVHAGENGIPCLYCHTNADKSTAATIPPISACMGCHAIVSGTNPAYQREIKKLTQYWEEQRPIPWQRVHDLPDFVYFSHKRHVTAGIDCKQCHGDVAKMTNVRAVNVLSMGFCVSCHRLHGKDKVYPSSIDCMTCHK